VENEVRKHPLPLVKEGRTEILMSYPSGQMLDLCTSPGQAIMSLDLKVEILKIVKKDGKAKIRFTLGIDTVNKKLFISDVQIISLNLKNVHNKIDSLIQKSMQKRLATMPQLLLGSFGDVLEHISPQVRVKTDCNGIGLVI
jgi:hypothetical protein